MGTLPCNRSAADGKTGAAGRVAVSLLVFVDGGDLSLTVVTAVERPNLGYEDWIDP